MRARFSAICAIALLIVFFGAAILAAQMPFREYPDYENNPIPLPSDYKVPGEWVFARLMYPPARNSCNAIFPGEAWQEHYQIPCYRYGWNRDWLEGATSWTIDYPRADRRIANVVRRLTRIDARSVEQPVNLDDGDDVYYYPYLYAVEVGSWELTNDQAHKLRDFLNRGGFLMVDDFHGSMEWATFEYSMQRIFPDRPIVEIPNDDAIFHTLWDMNNRTQVPGLQYVYSGHTYEQDGTIPHWRGIYDDHGRLMVAICYNMDLGDALEHADNPHYPQKYSAEGMQVFLNYLIYSMTH